MHDDVPASEVILGPDRFVLPWPFPADEDGRLRRAAEDDLGLSFSQVTPVSSGQGAGATDEFDPATDVYLDALMYAVDFLLTKERDWLYNTGTGTATDQRVVRETIVECVQSNCSGRGPADSRYFALPERMRFTVDPDRITDQSYFTVVEDGDGAPMLHVVLGKRIRQETEKMEVWSCRDQN